MLLRFLLFIFITLLANPVWTSKADAVRHIGLPVSSKSLRANVYVPPCSLPCLEQFIKSNYPPSVCSNPRDVECLCTRKSSSNYTLGEAALRCVFSACPSPGNLEFQVYGICLGVENYLPNTHSQLTATPIATPDPDPTHPLTSTPQEKTSTVTVPISTTTTTTTVIPTPGISVSPSSRKLSSSSHGPSPSVTPTTSIERSLSQISTSHGSDTSSAVATPTAPTTASSTSTISEPSISPEASSAASSGALSRPQLIGIYVGSGAAVVLIVAVFVFCFLRKRRRSKFQELKNPDFEIGGSMREPTPTRSLTDRRLNTVPHTPIGAYNTLSIGGIVSNPSIMHQQYERTSSNSSSGSRDNLSTTSRAESQLLPEKPSYRGVDATRPNIVNTGPDTFVPPATRPTARDVANRQRTHIAPQSTINKVGTMKKSPSPQMYGLPTHPKINWSPKSHSQSYPEHTQSDIPIAPREAYENPYWTTFDGTSLRPAKSLRTGADAMAPPPLRPLSNNNANGRSVAMRGGGSNFTNQRQNQSSMSKEAAVAEALQAHTPTRLSPVREVNSRGSTSRSPARNTSKPTPAIPPRSERRSRIENPDLVPPLFSPNPNSPQQNSLLAKRRGTTVANRMENQFTVSQRPGPPRGSVRRVSPFGTTPSSTTNNYHNNVIKTGPQRSPYPDYSPFQTQSPFKYDYDHDYGNEHARDDQHVWSPKGRRVTPTKRGQDMYLRIE